MANTNVQSQGAAEVVIDGIGTIPGPWQAVTGGGITAPDNKVNPGHMQTPEVLGGTASIDNIVVRRLYKLEEVHVLRESIEAKVGVGTGSVTRLLLDRNKKVFGRGITRNCLLIRCEVSDYDATSDDATTLELEFSVKGP
jgi:hypothetical protein